MKLGSLSFNFSSKLPVQIQNWELIKMGEPMEVDVPQTKGIKRKADGTLEPPQKLQVNYAGNFYHRPN